MAGDWKPGCRCVWPYPGRDKTWSDQGPTSRCDARPCAFAQGSQLFLRLAAYPCLPFGCGPASQRGRGGVHTPLLPAPQRFTTGESRSKEPSPGQPGQE